MWSHLAAFAAGGRRADVQVVAISTIGSMFRAQEASFVSFPSWRDSCVKGALIVRMVGGQPVIHAIKLLRVHGGCLGVERR